MKYEPLQRKQLKAVIHGNSDNTLRVPMIIHMWTNPDTFGEYREKAVQLLEKYPCDALILPINMPSADGANDYCWVQTDKHFDDEALDNRIIIESFEEMDRIEKEFPEVRKDIVLPYKPEDDGRYRIGLWWYCLFERHWSLRGMENTLTDYYLEPDNVHRLYGLLTDFYIESIREAAGQTNLDGIMFSDDIGHQTGPFFSTKIFDEFFRPYYTRICNAVHELGMDIWLHSCGNIREFIPGLIECGFDVLHPIQKYTMDEKDIADSFGNDICILGGMDVQQVIPWGTAEDVRKEVRYMYDTYLARSRRFMITAGNGITSDCRIDALEAFLDESYSYKNPKI